MLVVKTGIKVLRQKSKVNGKPNVALDEAPTVEHEPCFTLVGDNGPPRPLDLADEEGCDQVLLLV